MILTPLGMTHRLHLISKKTGKERILRRIGRKLRAAVRREHTGGLYSNVD